MTPEGPNIGNTNALNPNPHNSAQFTTFPGAPATSTLFAVSIHQR
jgi:hypothetical protein